MPATITRPTGERPRRSAPATEEPAIATRVREILARHPAVGLALGMVRGGRLESFQGGLADIPSGRPITEDTIFRIGSISKPCTAIAVMQLWERALVDLDAPANEYLRAYRLVPADPRWRQATIRHLLTHTAGIPDVRRVSDLLIGSWTPSGGRPPLHRVKAGEPIPSLAEYYRGGLRVVVEPGTAFAYTNHGFATLGQIVEDVSGKPLRRYLRESVFEPLAMMDTDLARSDRIRSRLATGYSLGPLGMRPVPDREWLGAGGGGVYSSTRDMARFVAALVGGGANEHGRVLEPATLAMMFAPQYRPDPRVPGVGLAFFRSDAGGHPVVGHDGILPGFNSGLLVAPDDGLGVVGFTNGSSGAFVWLGVELQRLLRSLLGEPEEPVRPDVPQHPEVWGELCGVYRLPAAVSDLRGRLAMGGGARVSVRGGRLTVRMLTPIPALCRGFALEPDDERDPYVFRLHLSTLGMPAVRVVFDGRAGHVTAAHADLGGQPLTVLRRPEARRPRTRPATALGTLAVGTAAAAVIRRRGQVRSASR